MHAASTKRSSTSRGTGSGRKRADGSPRLNERGNTSRPAARGTCRRRAHRSRVWRSLRGTARVEAAHDRDGHARGLAHHELGHAGDLVSNVDLGDEKPALRVGDPEDRAIATIPDTPSRRRSAPPPRAEGVGDRDTSSTAARRRRREPASPTCRRRRAAARRTPCRYWRCRSRRPRTRKPCLVSTMSESPRQQQHPYRLRLDELAAQPGATVVEIDINDATLDLRHDLLGDHDAIAVLQRRVLGIGGVGDERSRARHRHGPRECRGAARG